MSMSRRHFLIGASASAALTLLPRFALAAASAADTRLVVVLLRGGLDALHALPPIGDAHYTRARGALAVTGALPLDGHFGLHPSLRFLHALYGRRQLLPVLAIAPPYRQRSHFDAQDVLENGTATPGGSKTGWLNRAVATLQGADGLAIAPVMPLALRGDAAATTWSPPLAQDVDPLLLQRLMPLYARDAVLAPAFARAAQGDDDAMGNVARGRAQRLPQAMAAAARFMAVSGGPRVAFVEDSGWDTHGNQAGALARKLGELDAGVRAFHDGAPALWPRTVLAVLTEFGRTVAANGTNGTDHGTGGMALLAGGAVRGGRVAGDWPGLAPSSLYEGRDLRATTDLRALLKGVLAAHLHVPGSALDMRVFPGSGEVRMLDGLIAAA